MARADEDGFRRLIAEVAAANPHVDESVLAEKIVTPEEPDGLRAVGWADLGINEIPAGSFSGITLAVLDLSRNNLTSLDGLEGVTVVAATNPKDSPESGRALLLEGNNIDFTPDSVEKTLENIERVAASIKVEPRNIEVILVDNPGASTACAPRHGTGELNGRSGWHCTSYKPDGCSGYLEVTNYVFNGLPNAGLHFRFEKAETVYD